MSGGYVAIAAVPTAAAARYLGQLCAHWSHSLATACDGPHGTVTFPRDARGASHPGDAIVTFDARSDALDIRIDASAPAQLEALKGAVARHLDRFAFREAPLAFEWHGPDAA